MATIKLARQYVPTQILRKFRSQAVDTGKLILAQSAQTLKKVTLELGGKAPLLVFEDCDFDLAVQTALDANFYTAGEVCSNATRVFVQDSIAERFVKAMQEKTENLVIGDPMQQRHKLAPLSRIAICRMCLAISAKQKNKARIS